MVCTATLLFNGSDPSAVRDNDAIHLADPDTAAERMPYPEVMKFKVGKRVGRSPERMAKIVHNQKACPQVITDVICPSPYMTTTRAPLFWLKRPLRLLGKMVRCEQRWKCGPTVRCQLLMLRLTRHLRFNPLHPARSCRSRINKSAIP